MSRNVRAFINERYVEDESSSSTDSTDSAREIVGKEQRRPSSMVAAVASFFGDRNSNLRFNDDDKDYDDAWPRSSLLFANPPANGPLYQMMVAKVATLKEGLHAETLLRRRASDGSPLISNDYIQPRYMDLAQTRPKSSYLAEAKYDAQLWDLDSSGCNPPQEIETKSRSQLPRNALLQYLGKTALRKNELVTMDLKRAINLLTDVTKESDECQKPAAVKNSLFVLLRILEEELVIEGCASSSSSSSISSDAKNDSKTKPNAKAKKKSSTAEKRVAKSTAQSSGLFRKKSNPSIRYNANSKPVKKSVIDLQDVDVEVGIYEEIGDESYEDNKQQTVGSKKNSLCMDLFLCVSCSGSSSSYDSSMDEEEEEMSFNTKSSTLSSTPVHGNKVITSFDLRRIAYCGAETDENGQHSLLVWLYQLSANAANQTQCHAALCDDMQHAKSLATSLGTMIRECAKN